jgi:hypothetical protein
VQNAKDSQWLSFCFLMRAIRLLALHHRQAIPYKATQSCHTNSSENIASFPPLLAGSSLNSARLLDQAHTKRINKAHQFNLLSYNFTLEMLIIG